MFTNLIDSPHLMQSTKREQIVKSNQHGVFIKWTCIKKWCNKSPELEVMYDLVPIPSYITIRHVPKVDKQREEEASNEP